MKAKTCRLCLAVEVRMFNLGSTGARQFIRDILKANGSTLELRDSNYICFECKALLEKTYKFITRIITAQGILYNIKEKKISLATIKDIDRDKAGISNSCMIHVLKNINISGADNDEYHIMNENTNLAPIKEESSLSFDELNGPTEDYESDDTHTDIDDLDETFSLKKEKAGNIKKIKYQQYRASLLKPSKFILSALNVGDRSERRKNKLYNFKEKDEISDDEYRMKAKFFNLGEPDKEFRLSSSAESAESAESDFDMYDDDGRKIKKPKDVRVYPRKCDHCDYEVPAKRDHFRHYLFTHLNTPYPYGSKETFVCQFCGYISKNRVRHRNHELSHSTTRNFSCLQCPKKFYNSARLAQHVRNVHTTKFYECNYCGKQMKVRSDLITHFRIHTGEKPFKCHICGAGFAHKGNVGIHVRANHGYVCDKKQDKTPINKSKKLSGNKSSVNKKKKTKKRKLEREYSSDDSINLLQLKRNKDKTVTKELCPDIPKAIEKKDDTVTKELCPDIPMPIDNKDDAVTKELCPDIPELMNF